MAEHIYTILINEKFEAAEREGAALQCPVCAIREKLEKNELDRIMGAAMMEPSVRIETNKKGFCRVHFNSMLTYGNRLGLALILQSHLDLILDSMNGGSIFTNKGDLALSSAEKATKSCYLCDRVDDAMSKVLDNILHMWRSDGDFRTLFKLQKALCLPHFQALGQQGKRSLDKRGQAEFTDISTQIVRNYLCELKEDIDLFCKKFDYRFDDLPWGNSKDSPERAVRFLRGGV